MSKSKCMWFFVGALILLSAVLFVFVGCGSSAQSPEKAGGGESSTPALDAATKIALSTPPPSGSEYRVAKGEKTGNDYIVPVKRDCAGNLKIVGEPKRIEE